MARPFRIAIRFVTLALPALACRTEEHARQTPVLQSQPPAGVSARPALTQPPPSAARANGTTAAPQSSAKTASALTLTTKRLQLSKPAQHEHPGVDERSCSIDAEYPVVQGLGADLTRRLDTALEPQAKLEAECDFATSQEIRYTVALNDGEYLSVVYDSNWCCGAHPSYSKRFVTLRVADATLVTLDNAFRANASQALAQRLTKLARKTLPNDLELTADSLATYAEDPRNFSLEAGGVRFSLFNETPHAIQSAFEEGLLLGCDDVRPLLREAGSLAGFCRRR